MPEREANLSIRETWDQVSSLEQVSVEDKLRAFEPKITELNARIAAQNISHEELLGEITELDRRWGYCGDLFFVSGIWDRPEVTASSNGVMIQHVEDLACTISNSEGFTVSNNQVGLSFYYGRILSQTPYMKLDVASLAFALPHQISLQYLRPGSNEVVCTSGKEVCLAIETAQTLYEKMTCENTARFYSMSLEEQERFYRTLTEVVDRAMPSPGSLEGIVISDITTPYYYTATTDKPGLSMVSPPPGEDDLRISGVIMGVTVPRLMHGSLKDRRCSVGDMDQTDELAAVIDPHQTSFIDPTLNNQFIVVPLDRIDLEKIGEI